MRNGKWEIMEMNRRCVTQSTQQHCNGARSDDEEPGLQASCTSLANFVVLLKGGSAVCDKNKNGKATEIYS